MQTVSEDNRVRRLTPEQLRAAKAAKREDLSRRLIQACLGEEVDIKLAMDEIDRIFFAAVEYALWIWFDDILPLHFGQGATKRYGYPERKSGYLIGKYTGQMMGGRTSHFRLPKSAAYSIARTKQSRATAPDPYPLEFTGELRARVTQAPATPPTVKRVTGGYKGRVVISLPAYIRADDIAALIRYVPQDIEKMLNGVSVVVRGALSA